MVKGLRSIVKFFERCNDLMYILTNYLNILCKEVGILLRILLEKKVLYEIEQSRT